MATDEELTVERIREIHLRGRTTEWELPKLCELAVWALKEKAKARARLERHRGKAGKGTGTRQEKPAPGNGQKQPKPVKATQNGREGAKKGTRVDALMKKDAAAIEKLGITPASPGMLTATNAIKDHGKPLPAGMGYNHIQPRPKPPEPVKVHPGVLRAPLVCTTADDAQKELARLLSHQMKTTKKAKA